MLGEKLRVGDGAVREGSLRKSEGGDWLGNDITCWGKGHGAPKFWILEGINAFTFLRALVCLGRWEKRLDKDGEIQ